MGFSDWSDAAYKARQNYRKQHNQSAFTYDDTVRQTGQRVVHPQMNPFGRVRESRDSAQHPQSLAIGVVFDVTGSMGYVPRVLQTKLGALMRMLVERGYVRHPQILFGAVGDATCDAVPLQIGQFEAGLEMDDDLGKIYIEGGGGGQVRESYELAMYYFARHTQIDCWEKRREKGFLFTIGDEMPYPQIARRQVAQLIGGELRADLPTAKVVAELTRRYHYFHIIPTDTAHGQNPAVHYLWQALLGDRVLLLDDAAAVAETIALTIGLTVGAVVDVDAGVADLDAVGAGDGATQAAVLALTRGR